jgi:transcriptional regulator with XRE-family HTH domain
MDREAQIDTDGFTIDEEFKNLLPRLNSADFEQLEKNILKEGCREKLTIWKEKRLLIDGHHRYEICDKHGLKYGIEEKSFKNRDAVIEWMLNHQKGRRNMNRFQWAEVILRRKERIAEIAKANQRAGGGAVKKKSAKPVNTLETLAKLAGISRPTLKQVEFILKNADQNTIRKLRNGNAGVSINGVHEELQERIGKTKTKKSGATKAKRRIKSIAPKRIKPMNESQQDDITEQISHDIAIIEEIEQQYRY